MKFEEDCHKGTEGFAFKEEIFVFNRKDIRVYRTDTHHEKGLIFIHGFNAPISMYTKMLQILSK